MAQSVLVSEMCPGGPFTRCEMKNFCPVTTWRLSPAQSNASLFTCPACSTAGNPPKPQRVSRNGGREGSPEVIVDLQAVESGGVASSGNAATPLSRSFVLIKYPQLWHGGPHVS